MGGINLMEVYKKADEKMVDEIMRVMTSCFGDPIWILKFFFKERFDIGNCYVCIEDKKIVSVLHVIKSKLKIGREILNGIYIYGACTLREYRKRGYMTGLINYVHEIYSKSGYECSFLLPANQEVSRFYEKIGYKNFFKLRRCEFSKNEIIDLCKENTDEVSDCSLSLKEIEALRQEIYERSCGVIYSERDIGFAGKLYELFSSGAVVSTEFGYAICGFVSSGEIKIRDFTCKTPGIIGLIKKIYSRFPGQRKYIIETSTQNRFFKNFGNAVDYGMIMPLSNLASGLIETAGYFCESGSYPYMGISLE